MEFKRWSACVTYATNIASEHARSSKLTRYVRLSLLPQAGEGLTVYARCSDGSKKGIFLSRMSVNTRILVQISDRTPRLQLTFLSRAITVSHTHTREWHVLSIHYNNSNIYTLDPQKTPGFRGLGERAL